MPKESLGREGDETFDVLKDARRRGINVVVSDAVEPGDAFIMGDAYFVNPEPPKGTPEHERWEHSIRSIVRVRGLGKYTEDR